MEPMHILLIQILLVVATAILVLVGYGQLRVVKKGLKFQQRTLSRPVFDATKEFIRSVCQQHGFSQEQLDRYWHGIDEGHFIFDKRRRHLLEEVYEKANKLQFVKSQKESHKNDEKYQRYVKEEHQLMSWFSDRLRKIEEDFRDYLEFK